MVTTRSTVVLLILVATPPNRDALCLQSSRCDAGRKSYYWSTIALKGRITDTRNHQDRKHFPYEIRKTGSRSATSTGTASSDPSSSLPHQPLETRRTAQQRKSRPPNNHVRNLLRLVMESFQPNQSSEGFQNMQEEDSSSIQFTPEWGRLRNYLYRTSDQLTILQVRRILMFLNELFPNDYEIQRFIIQSSPRILKKSIVTNLQPTVDFLQGLYGEDLFRQAIQRNPDLLLTSGTGYDADALDLVEVYLRKELKLSQSIINQIKKKAPFVFRLSVSKIISVVEFLKGPLMERGYTEDKMMMTIRKLILLHPNIFQLSVETGLTPRIRYLQDRFNFTLSDVACMLQSSSAAVLGLSVQDNLKPTLDYLCELAQSQEQFRKSLLAHPQLMGLSLQNLQLKVRYWDTLDELTIIPNRRYNANIPQESKQVDRLAARVLLKAPAVYSLSLNENIIPKVEFLGGIWGCPCPHYFVNDKSDGQELAGGPFDTYTSDMTLVSESNITSSWNTSCSLSSFSSSSISLSDLIYEYPNLLTLSLEGNIRPTVNFYNKTGYIVLDDQWKRVNHPTLIPESHATSNNKILLLRGRYIAASLFLRLLPRWHYVMVTTTAAAESKHTIPANNNKTAERYESTILLSDHSISCTRKILPAHILVSASDEAFCDYMGFSSAAYTSYKAMNSGRLKFSSQFDTWLKTGRPIDV